MLATPFSVCPCPPFLFQALLRARGLPACQFEEEEWEAYRRLKEKAPPGEHVESSTPTDISMPGVRELPASRAASKQQQQQWQKGQGQGQGRALLASGSAASKQQGQGQQQPGGVVGKGESEAATRAKLQDVQCAQGKRGPLSSRKKAKKQVGAWRGEGEGARLCGKSRDGRGGRGCGQACEQAPARAVVPAVSLQAVM